VFFPIKNTIPFKEVGMKVPEYFDFDKRVIDRITKKNPSHRTRIKEYIGRLTDNKENVEVLNIKDLLPTRKNKGGKQ